MRTFRESIFNRAIYARALSILMMLAMQATLARSLSPHDFGLVQLVLSVNFLFAYLTTLGIPFSLLKILPSEKGEMHGAGVSESLFGSLVMCIGSVLICGLGVCLIELTAGMFSRLMGLSQNEFFIALSFLVIFAWNYTLSEIFRAWGRVLLANFIVGFGVMGIVFFTTLGMRLTGAQVETTHVLWLLLVGSLVAFCYGIYRLQSNLSSSLKAHQIDIRNSLVKAQPFFLSLIVGYALSQADFWIAFYRLSPTDGGSYSQVLRLVQFFAFYQTAIVAKVPQAVISNFKQQNYLGILQINNRIAKSSVMLLIVPCLLYLTIGGIILRIVYGEVTSDQILVLGILSVGQVLIQACGPQALILSLIGEIKATNLIFCCALLGIILGGILLPISSIVSVAFLAFAANVLAQGILRLLFARIVSPRNADEKGRGLV